MDAFVREYLWYMAFYCDSKDNTKECGMYKRI